MDQQTITFNQNWNQKLDCKSFSTVRIQNNSKYILGEIYLILLNDKSGKTIKNYGFAKLVAKHEFFLDHVTPAITYLDTNYDKESFVQMVRTMYKHHNIDFGQKKMVFMVLQYTGNK